MKPVLPGVYTVDIEGKPTVSFEAKNPREANELAREDWFRGDLMLLMSEGEFLWDGKATLRTRIATETEATLYQGLAAEAEDSAGEIILAFLVALDGVPV